MKESLEMQLALIERLADMEYSGNKDKACEDWCINHATRFREFYNENKSTGWEIVPEYMRRYLERGD